jgi:hypothetical protein
MRGLRTSCSASTPAPDRVIRLPILLRTTVALGHCESPAHRVCPFACRMRGLIVNCADSPPATHECTTRGGSLQGRVVMSPRSPPSHHHIASSSSSFSPCGGYIPHSSAEHVPCAGMHVSVPCLLSITEKKKVKKPPTPGNGSGSYPVSEIEWGIWPPHGVDDDENDAW